MRTTPLKMHRTHTDSSELELTLGVPDIEDVYRSRLLKWVGKMVCMETERLPRRMMTCWVRNPRKNGRPHMTWGATVDNALRYYNIPTVFDEWRLLPGISSVEWLKLIQPWKVTMMDDDDDQVVADGDLAYAPH
jgi:hypothetical protein